MKVMQLLPELNSGGVERGTLEIARALVKEGHQSVVVSNGGRLVAQLEAEGSTHLTLPIHKKSLSSLWQIRPLRRLIQTEQPDIVHVRSRVPAWLTHFALRGMPAHSRPHLVSTVHGFYSINRYSAIMTQAEKVIAVSDSVVDYITTHYPQCPPERIVRIYRGIDPKAFPHGYQPSAQWINQIYTLFPQLENKFLICLPGRITRLKGHETLIELMENLQAEYPDVHAIVVGGADPKKKPIWMNSKPPFVIEDYVTRLPLSDIPQKFVSGLQSAIWCSLCLIRPKPLDERLLKHCLWARPLWDGSEVVLLKFYRAYIRKA